MANPADCPYQHTQVLQQTGEKIGALFEQEYSGAGASINLERFVDDVRGSVPADNCKQNVGFSFQRQ